MAALFCFSKLDREKMTGYFTSVNNCGFTFASIPAARYLQTIKLGENDEFFYFKMTWNFFYFKMTWRILDITNDELFYFFARTSLKTMVTLVLL